MAALLCAINAVYNLRIPEQVGKCSWPSDTGNQVKVKVKVKVKVEVEVEVEVEDHHRSAIRSALRTLSFVLRTLSFVLCPSYLHAGAGRSKKATSIEGCLLFLSGKDYFFTALMTTKEPSPKPCFGSCKDVMSSTGVNNVCEKLNFLKPASLSSLTILSGV